MQKKKNFEKIREKRTKQKNYVHEKITGTEREGLVVAHFGASVEVEDTHGKVFHAHLRRNAEPCITGDRVLWRLENDQTAVVAQVLPRKSLLARPEKHGKQKLIAANIDKMVIVTAPTPLFAERLIDRYIVAAEVLGITPIILFNKMDLLNEASFEEVQICLKKYEKIGYVVLYSSVYQENGLKKVNEALTNQTSVLVGVSGVGKSSIISSLTGVEDIKVGEVGESGKHTTTTTRLYHLPDGGNLIDSPGVREFSLWHLNSEEILKGFVEIHAYEGECKFRSCKHQTEPGCALMSAVAEGKINADRWFSYQTLLQDMAGMKK